MREPGVPKAVVAAASTLVAAVEAKFSVTIRTARAGSVSNEAGGHNQEDDEDEDDAPVVVEL